MKVELKKLKEGTVKLTISPDEKLLSESKKLVINSLRSKVKAPGFREGHAPDKVVEQQLGAEYIQSLTLEQAVGRAFAMAAEQEKLKTLGSPEVELKKFVAYTTLEFTAEVEVVPEFKLPDYKNLKVKISEKPVTDKDIDEVVENIRKRLADSKEVKRAAENGDKVWIDFKGVETKTKKAISGADGKNYPLQIGSGTFIKGFEPEVIGLKTGDKKEFKVTFPKDYHVKSLQNQDVTFNVKVNKVEEVIKPKADDKLAKKAGPFKTVNELRADIDKQLATEKRQHQQRELRQELVNELVKKSKFTPPPKMLERVQHDMKHEFERELSRRGLTMDQYLEREGQTKEEFETNEMLEKAVQRAKASIVLTEVAEVEKMKVTPEELDIRMQMLRQQYSDPKIQEELAKPEAERELLAQMLTEKTIAKLTEYNS